MTLYHMVQPIDREGRPEGDPKEVTLGEAQRLCSKGAATPVGKTYRKGEDDTKPVRSRARAVESVRSTTPAADDPEP